MSDWYVLIVAILIETVATSALKLSDGFTKLLPSLVVIIGYVFSFYAMAISVRTIPVGLAYAVWGGVGITLITIVGWIFLGQKLSVGQVLGVALITTGVIVLRVFSPTAAD
jgi:multidrug transporter EmrE-like cation transporter